MDKYVAAEVAKAVAAEHDKAATDKPVSDEQVRKAENWHRAIYEKMEFVVYTGPGQAMMHHWVQPATPPASKPLAKSGGAAPATSTKGK